MTKRDAAWMERFHACVSECILKGVYAIKDEEHNVIIKGNGNQFMLDDDDSIEFYIAYLELSCELAMPREVMLYLAYDYIGCVYPEEQ